MEYYALLTRCGSHWHQSSRHGSHQQQHKSSRMLGGHQRKLGQVHKQGQGRRQGQGQHTGLRQQPEEQKEQQSTERKRI